MTPGVRLAIRTGEGLASLAVASFAVTLSPLLAFLVGLGYAVVLFELAKWERAIDVAARMVRR